MLGDELFTRALHNYIKQWHGKHPMPFDFFNCMNTGAGLNMNWFWKSWFFDRGIPDLAITKVSVKKNVYTVTVSNLGTKPIPVDLTVYYKDGTTQLVHQNISAWRNCNKTFTINLFSRKKIQKMILGNTWDPDTNKENNIWESK